jgi:hypothetical protein
MATGILKEHANHLAQIQMTAPSTEGRASKPRATLDLHAGRGFNHPARILRPAGEPES